MTCVLFDLDGTLADTRELILHTFREVWKTHFGYCPEDAVFAATVGLPLVQSLDMLVAAGPTLVPVEQREALIGRLLQHYTELNLALHDAMIAPFEGVTDMLDALTERGHKLGVVTSKRRRGALMSLQALGLEKYFQTIVTTEDTTRHKPHGDPVEHAVAALGCEASQSYYVGDAPFDLQAGHAAGVKPVAATWGAHDVDALLAERPHAVVNSPGEVVRLFI